MTDRERGPLGIVGGMTWHATVDYHRLANELTVERLGRRHSARLLIATLDFADLLSHLAAGRDDRAGARIVAAARTLDAAGAGLILLAANAAHRWFAEVDAATAGPVLHIAEPVRARAAELGATVLGVLGTSGVAGVYAAIGCEVVVPAEPRQHVLDALILDELATRPADERDLPELAAQVAALAAQGADAVVLACTDFSRIAGQLRTEVPVLDSTALHVAAALAAITMEGTE